MLVEILERHGPKALPRLDAMFAFGHYDMARQELLLARDIFGEKPLYYVDHPDFFAFASELHALANLPGFDARIDRAAIASYLCFQYVPTPQTIYGSARKLPPASYLTVGPAGAIQVRSYYSFDTSAAEHSTRSIDSRRKSSSSSASSASCGESTPRRLTTTRGSCESSRTCAPVLQRLKSAAAN